MKAQKWALTALLVLTLLPLAQAATTINVTLLTGIDTDIPSGGAVTKFSPSGEYLAATSLSSPYIFIYEKTGPERYELLPSPATLPAGGAFDLDWAPNDEFLVVAHLNSPYISIYHNNAGVFEKVANPATLPTGASDSVTWSPDGTYVAVAHATSPYLSIYTHSGTTFTKEANPAALPGGNARSIRFSPDSNFLAIGFGASPFIHVYREDAGVFTKLANPSSLPTSTPLNMDWTPDGTRLIYGAAPPINDEILALSGSTLTKESGFTLPGRFRGVSWVDAVTGVVSYDAIGTPLVLDYSGGIFTPGDSLSLDGSAGGIQVSIHPNGKLLATEANSAPFLRLYRIGGAPIIEQSSPIGIIKDSAETAFGLTEDSGNWIFGILTVALVGFAFFRVSQGSAIATGIGGLLGVGLSVAFGFLPIWFLLLIVFLVIGLAGKSLYGGGNEAPQ